MKKNIELQKVIDFIKSDLLSVKGEKEGIFINCLKPSQFVDKYTLDWIHKTKKNKQEIAELSKATVILVDKDVKFSRKIKVQKKVLLFVDNPKLILAKVANEFFVDNLKPIIHHSSQIHPDAIIGQNVFIGPNCIIGKCIIGNDVEFHGNNFIYDNVTLCNNIEIHAGVIIGSEAHNFVEDSNGEKVKFPHLGGVIIEDDVIIGANSVVSRGVLENTLVGKRTKIAQLVIIGSNNTIGNDCSLRSNVMTSGSVNIGDNTVLAPSSTIREYCTVGRNSFVGMGAVVTKNIPDNEIWIGNPAKLMKKTY